MIYRTIIHCCDPNLQKDIIKLARKGRLSVKICKYNPNGIIIKGPKRYHNAFCERVENSYDYGIFYDHKHPKEAFYVFKPHYRLGNDVDINKLTNQLSMIPMGVYGRTPEWYGRMYQADLNLEVSPTIAVISLNNNYNLEDLRSYWTHVCGLSEMPTVIDVLVGHKIKQRNTGLGVAYHNTLELEIIGALCPKATLLFISAPNTCTAVRGVLRLPEVPTERTDSSPSAAPQDTAAPFELSTAAEFEESADLVDAPVEQMTETVTGIGPRHSRWPQPTGSIRAGGDRANKATWEAAELTSRYEGQIASAIDDGYFGIAAWTASA